MKKEDKIALKLIKKKFTLEEWESFPIEIKNNTILITEVSSFQLETTSRFCPHISCILNITPDHLDRHYNMQN